MNHFSIRPSVIDEICLEGLDGITCEALWTRLSDRLIVPLPLPKPLCNEIWNIVRTSTEIEVYELPKPREAFVLFDRYEHVDPHLGMVVEPEVLPPVIYIHCPLEDKEKNNRGSCSTYHTRVNITHDAKLLTLDEALERWGMKLVLVGSQKARNEAILGCDFCPGVELTLIQYCILERVGRSRYQGEVSQGKISLQDMKIEAKSLFYHRKLLMKHNLITKQVHHQKLGAHNVAGTLLHLPRFYVERKPKACYLTAEVVEILRDKNNCMAEYDELKKKLGMENSLKKLFKTAEFQRYVKTDILMPYRAIYPDATKSEWKHKGSDKEKNIRCVQLMDPEVDVLDSWTKEEEQEPSEDNGLLDYSGVLLDRSVLSQAYRLIESAGPGGLSQTELGRLMGQSKLCARMICRRLQSMRLVLTLLDDVGRQRVSKFVSCKYDDSNMATMFRRERTKMLEFLNTSKKFVPAQEEGEAPEEISGEHPPSASESAVKLPSIADSLTEELLLYTEENSNDSTRPPSPVDQDESQEKEGEAVEVTFIETKVCPSVKGYSVNVLDTTGLIETGRKDTTGLSYRLLKRANMIIENVRLNHVITDPTKLMKMIQEEEAVEGHAVKFDKKSLLRMLMKLSKDGYLKIIQAKLASRLKKSPKVLTFVCECDVTAKHSIIQSELELAKMKMFMRPRSQVVKALPAAAAALQSSQHQDDDDLSKFNSESIEQSKQELKEVASRTTRATLVYDARACRKYGYQPKFVRMKLLHNLLYYLIRTRIGEPIGQKEAVEFLRSQGHAVTPDLQAEMSPMYAKEVSWKMFMPPLPKHTGWPAGWTIMCDVLLRLPLSVLMQVCHISFVVPNIGEYLDHPIKKHFLVRNLPIALRNDLTVARKYIYSVHEIIQRLCYIGLVQFGPQKLKEKDQVFLYLNQRTTLYDTRTSDPGYHQTKENQEFPCTRHEFLTPADVEKYWCEFWDISVHTNLGMRNVVCGQQIILEKAAYKASLLEALKPKQPDTALKCDNGEIPGDRRGAAGMDTSMFSHLKRNWHWTSVAGKQYQPYKKDEHGLPVRDSKLQNASRTKIPFKEFPCHKKINAATLQSSYGLAVKTRPASSRKPSILTVKHRPPVKNIVRNIVPRRSGRKRPSYDEIDKQALQKMNKLRVDWYPDEDKLLLLCKVGLMYLFPDWRKITIGLYIIRDIMHRVTESYNKTSKACQRRILYIMKNPKTAKSVQQCLEEIRWSPEIAKNFGQQFIKKFRDDAEDYNEFINKVNIHFVELITVLRRIFNRTGVNLCPFSEMLPKSIKEFEERYDIRTTTNEEESASKFEEPETVADVQRAVVRNVIHSSLCSVRDKTRWNYHLYNIYKQYPDQLLRSVLARLRATQMVAVKKNMAKSVAKTGNLPLSSAPFQLSITYENQMRSKYGMSTFRESNQLLHKLIDEFNTPERKGVHISVTDGGTASGLCELTIGFLTNYEICIPEQIVILDPRIREDDPTYERILKRYQDILRNTRASVGPPGRGDEFDEEESEDEASSKPAEPRSEPEPEPAALLQGAAGETQLMKRPADAILTPQGRVALSMMRLEGADADPEAKQHLHDYFVVNSSNLYVSFATGPHGDDEAPPLPPELLHSAGWKRHCDGFMAAIKEEACVKDCREIEDEILLELFDDQKRTLEIARSIVTYVKTKGVLGATDRSIFKHYRSVISRDSTVVSLLDILRRLCHERVLMRTGICEPRHVHREHAAPWLAHTTRLTRLDREKLPPVVQAGRKRKRSGVHDNDQIDKCVEVKRQRLDSQTESPETESVSVETEKNYVCIQDQPKQPTASLSNEVQQIKEGAEFVEGAGESLNISIRPWIRIDGTVNRRVLDQWLSTVLSYCISHPGVTMKAVQDKYQFQLPYHTRELIEMLVKLKCLHLQKIKRTSISLFSKMSQTNIEPATGLEDPSDILVMPMVNAVLTFGAFVGERANAATFLTHIK